MTVNVLVNEILPVAVLACLLVFALVRTYIEIRRAPLINGADEE